ncbi:ABC transporter substrate-binding protein, partial [bacterium]
FFYDSYTRTRSYFDNSEMAATGLPTGEEAKILEKFRGRVPEEVFTREYRPPSFAVEAGGDANKKFRENMLAAKNLLEEAGWKVKENKLVNGKGETFAFEILMDNPAFERISLPFTKNLEKLGIEAKVRTIDPSQYENRMENFDFDMTVEVFGQSQSPGNEQRDFWGSKAAEIKGSRNVIGIRDPVVDELVELIISAKDREGLVAASKALDRVLQWGHYVIPHWHISVWRLAYWNKFGIPKTIPAYDLPLDAWWSRDAAK